MKNKQLIYALVLAGMSLGTAWAIRGQFGHEQGAAWAGGIGGLAIVLLAKRADWYSRIFKLGFLSALGWGVGGMISYGIVVGYGRASDFGNAYYGLSMLFVIGALFGLLGGGLFGLGLEDSDDKPVDWARLALEMVAGGIIFYQFLINSLEWLMTPPRSEAWATCLGMGAAMVWYMVRRNYYSSLRVALFAALGGGFGFGFGNFLQVMGAAYQIKFNFWNVMEYSIGFFGGSAMAYGVFSSKWPEQRTVVTKTTNLFPLLMLVLVIPFIVWDQSFETERLMRNYEPLLGAGSPAAGICVQWTAFISVLLFTAWALWNYSRKEGGVDFYSYTGVRNFFLIDLGLYTFYSLLITGAFVSTYRIEQYLYIVNLVIIALLVSKVQRPDQYNKFMPSRKVIVALLVILAVLAVVTLIAINSHDGLNHAQRRFE
jgi:hypothetical protein